MARSQILLGSIKTLDHDVAGDVYAIDERTIEVRKFVYDGTAPDAFWYGDVGGRATSAGDILLDPPNCGKSKLGPFRSPTTVRVEMPAGKTLNDYGFISVWCRLAAVSFGGLAIPKEKLAGLPEAGAGECGAGTSSGSGGSSATEETGTEPFPVKDNMSCEPLGDDLLQVRWLVDGDDVNVELVGRISDTQYMGFGPSGSDTATQMVGSDPAICILGDDTKYTAIDYYMSSRAPCANGVGVCPDVDATLSTGSATSQFSKISGERNGDIVVVRYTRPLRAVDTTADRPISTAEKTFVTWAVGPTATLGSGGRQVLDHGRTATVAPRESVSIEFGRTAKSNCEPFVTKTAVAPDAPSVPDVEPFERPVAILDPAKEVFARIGPSGGDRGLQAVAQRPGWGIAWYMNQEGSDPVLAQTLGVERGKEYTFKVMGGDDPENASNFHPLYITSSEVGGDVETETVYAGPVSGRECRITDGDATADAKTYSEFWKSLGSQCVTDATVLAGAGTLKWKVDNNTPYIVYYQCRTHRLLGWRIRVFDQGKASTDDLEKVNVVPRVLSTSCDVLFKGSSRNFQGCRKNLEGGVDVYWNIDESAKTIETLMSGKPGAEGGYSMFHLAFFQPLICFTAVLLLCILFLTSLDSLLVYRLSFGILRSYFCVPAWSSSAVGWGWGQRSMVPSGGGAAAIAFADPSSGAVSVRDYSLSARSSAGVQPGTSQELSGGEAELVDGSIFALFTRPLGGSISNGPTDAIWAVGPAVSSATSLMTHTSRSSGNFDLSTASSSSDSVGSSLETLWKVHAWLMALAWLGLAPIGILGIRRFKKYNPLTFRIHQGLLVLATLFTIAAYIIALVEGRRLAKVHFSLGTVVMVLALFQVVLGVIRPAKGAPKRGLFYALHSNAGRLTWIIAVANVFVGLFLARSNAPTWLKVVAGVLVGLYVLAFLIFETVLSGSFPSKEVSEAPEADGASDELRSPGSASP